MGEELRKLNESFNKKLEEYKNRLSPKEIKQFNDLDGLVYFFYLAGYELGRKNDTK